MGFSFLGWFPFDDLLQQEVPQEPEPVVPETKVEAPRSSWASVAGSSSSSGSVKKAPPAVVRAPEPVRYRLCGVSNSPYIR